MEKLIINHLIFIALIFVSWISIDFLWSYLRRLRYQAYLKHLKSQDEDKKK